MNPIFQFEIKSVEADKSLVIIKVGDVELESKQALCASELSELQKHIAFCNKSFHRKQ